MIPPSFDYAAPDTLEQTIGLLGEHGGEAKLLAGGHSLLPLMKLRLAAPTVLIDIRKLAPQLRGIERANGSWRIGALTRHADLQVRDELGVVAHAAAMIADQQVRNRGTIGGSLAHGDAAADLPAVMLATDAEIELRGPEGTRTVAAGDMFKGFLTTAVAPDEVLTTVKIPALDGYGWGYEKFARRAEDWAMVGVCALVRADGNGNCADVRVGLINMGGVPLRAHAVEDALRGAPLDAESIARAAEHAADGTDPAGDLNASTEYKQHLARVLTGRALEQAAGLGGGQP
jgi:carbon-monoxide dehydrogenase medium subunit